MNVYNRCDSVSLLEACYATDSDEQRWLRRLLDAALPMLDLGLGLGLSVIRTAEDGCPHVLLLGGAGPLSEPFQHFNASVPLLPARDLAAMFQPERAIVRASCVKADALTQHVKEIGASDIVGVLGYPAGDLSFVLGLMMDGKARLHGGSRALLARVRAHLESALRLRILAPELPEAVLTPTGKVVHAVSSASEVGARQALTSQVRAIERLRTRRERRSAPDPLGTWNALVEGRWTLVEREASSGQRLYFALPNARASIRHRALSEVERRAAELTAQGLSSKQVAHELCLSESRVAVALGVAAAKLGMGSRTELTRLVGSLLRTASSTHAAPLSSAEREVLRYLEQGLSNADIAALRGTSQKTVANQVSSILQKTGAVSRRAAARSAAPLRVELIDADG